MFLCVEQQCTEKSGSNSSLSTHYIIIDGSCRGQVHLFFRFVTGGRMLDEGLFCSRARNIARASLISVLIVMPPHNLAPDTFHNIMWKGSEDSANETA